MLVVRADANSRIGAGHVMRCLALAQGWPGPVRFVCDDPPGWVRARLEREGMALGEGFEGADWILVDGYQFSAHYLESLRAYARVLCFDDGPRLPVYPVDLVWNPNLGAPPHAYAPTPGLLGPSFYPLRREFLATPPRSATPERAQRLVISMGGADPPGFTLVALAAARSLDLEVRVVVGASNPARETLWARLSESERADLDNLAPDLAWGDFAVSAAGVTSYELAYLGVPTLLVELADNQRPIARAWDAAGAARNLGEPPSGEAVAEALRELAQDEATRAQFARRGREIVDGRGVERVIAALQAR